MKLNENQVNTIINNAPQGVDRTQILDGLVDRGYTLDKVDMEKARQRVLDIRKSQPIDTSQYESKMGFAGKAVDFVFGGGKLAQGLGKSIASKDILADNQARMQEAQDIEFDIIKRLQKNRQAGLPTEGLEKALFNTRKNIIDIERQRNAFLGALPTNKEVVGSALRLGTSAAAPSVVGGTTKGTALGGATGFGVTTKGMKTGIAGVASRVGTGVGAWQGAKQGAKIGAIGGAFEGFGQGAGYGLEENKDAGGVMTSALVGGSIGAGFGGVLGGAIGALSGKSLAKQQEREAIRRIINNDPNAPIAQYQIDADTLKTNPLTKDALAQGYDPDAVALGAQAQGETSNKMNKMLDYVENGLGSDTNAQKARVMNRPQNVVAEGLAERAKYAYKVNDQAVDALEETAKALKGQTADFSPAVQSLLDDFDELEVVVRNGKVVPLEDSILEGQDALVRELQKVVNRASKSTADDAYSMHKLKRFIYESVDYGKTKDGLPGQLETTLKRFAYNLDQTLDNSYPAYAQANSDYSISRGFIDEFERLAGRRFNIKDPNADKALSSLTRTITAGDTNRRAQVLQLINDLEDLARKGGNEFDDDLVSLQLFANKLEDKFPDIIGDTSFKGEIRRGVTAVGRVSEFMRNPIQNTLETTADLVDRNRTPENAVKAMRNLLNRNVQAVPEEKTAGWLTRLFTGANATSADDVAQGAVAGKIANSVTGSTNNLATKTDNLANTLASNVDDAGQRLASTADDVPVTPTRLDNLANYSPDEVNTIKANVLAGKTLDKNGNWVKDPTQQAVIVDSDLVKQANPNFDPKNPSVLHADSSDIAGELLEDALKLDESGVVRFTSGGAGSGKSEVIVDQLKQEPGLIVDGTFAKPENAVSRINQALEAGKKVEVDVVYPNVRLAYLFNQLRSRSVPDNVFIDTHAGQRSTLPMLYKIYKDNPNVNWKLFSNARFGKTGTEFSPEDIGKAIQQQSKVDVTAEVELAKKQIAQMGKEDLDRLGTLLTYYKSNKNVAGGMSKEAIKTAKANIKEGGFTMNMIDDIDYAGKPYIAVSPYPERSAVYSEGVSNKSFADFLEKNRDLITKKGYAMGGWLDTDSGKFYLDVVVPVPKAQKETAIQLAKDANQIAIFDLEDFVEIPTGGTGEKTNVMSLEARQALVDSVLNFTDDSI